MIPGLREMIPLHCRAAVEEERALLSVDGSLGHSLFTTTLTSPNCYHKLLPFLADISSVWYILVLGFDRKG